MTTIALKLNTDARPAAKAIRRTSSLRRTFAHRAELIGVLTLMASSAAYALYTLAHLA